MSTGGDKTEAATPKKRADAVKEGDSLRSRDLGAALALAALLGWLAVAGGWALDAGRAVMRDGLTIDRVAIDRFEPGRAAVAAILTIVAPFGILVVMLIVAAIAGGVVLGGGAWTSAALRPKATRIDPVKGLGRLFGADALLGLAQSLAKVVVLTALTGWLLWHEAAALIETTYRSAAFAGELIVGALVPMVLVVGVAALLDILLQWRRREARLRMSKQEVGDEHKSNEGSPERKRAQRERQYAIAARSARKAMGEATVVLNNPLHFAVAVRYRPGIDGVPVVVARGVDEAARAIRDLAAEHDVPQIEAATLARAIYFTSQVGQPVVHDLYLAVATVLAFVFDLEARAARRVPEVEVPPALRFGPDGRVKGRGD